MKTQKINKLKNIDNISIKPNKLNIKNKIFNKYRIIKKSISKYDFKEKKYKDFKLKKQLSLTLYKQKSILDGITLTECVNKDLINRLLITNLIKNERIDEEWQLNMIKKNIKENKIEHTYKKDKHGWGRLITQCSFINLRKELRHTFAKDLYVDIDIVNCQPTILYQILTLNNINCPNLKKYVTERDHILNEIINTYSVNRDTAKELLIRLIYCGSIKSWIKDYNLNTYESSYIYKYITSFSTELKNIADIITKYNKQLVNDIDKHKKEKGQNAWNASYMSFFLQEHEERVLQTVYTYLLNNKYIKNNIVSLCHDGIMILKNDFNDELLNKINKNVKQKLNLDLQFTFKEINNFYTDYIIDNSINYSNKSYEDIKLEFEKKCFKVNNPVMFCEIDFKGDLICRKKNDFKERFAELRYIDFIKNNGGFQEKECIFIDRWFKDSKRTYEKIEFNPTVNASPNNVYNSFDGFLITKNQHILFNKEYDYNDNNFKFILDHINDLCNNDPPSYEYLLDYLANILQHRKQPKTSIVFQSEQGVGKDTFFNWFGYKIMGDKYYINTPSVDNIFGHFNSSSENKIFIIITEASGKDTFCKNDNIKAFIDGAKLNIERKGIDPYTQENYASLCFFTNNDNPIKLEPKERRFIVFNCSSKWVRSNQDVKFEHFSRLVKILNSGDYDIMFYTYLMKRDITKRNFLDRPITEAYEQMARSQSSILYSFFTDLFYSEKTNTFLSKQLYNSFIKWKNENGYEKYEFTIDRFGKELNKDFSICFQKEHNRNGNTYIFNYNQLNKLLFDKGFIPEIFNDNITEKINTPNNTLDIFFNNDSINDNATETNEFNDNDVTEYIEEE